LPSGELWLHEIKHDGFRVIARKDGDRVRITEAGRRALAARSEKDR
jgi:ATP-dependent DNA ligase